jgi:tetratricopeptide (TPR) repeat protein
MVSQREQIESELGTVQEQIDRRLKILQSGKGDWRLRYELAYLYDHLKNRPATYRQLQRLYSEYPHHRDSLVMTAKMLHQDERYREAIPFLRLALVHARGEEELIAQLTGWLGLAHFKLGESDTATDLLLQVAREYPEQIHYVLQAYATLIRYSMQAGDTDTARDYAEQVQRYAERVVKGGKAAEYPPLYTKMSQIMRLAGDQAQSQSWKQRGQKKAIEQRAGGS